MLPLSLYDNEYNNNISILYNSGRSTNEWCHVYVSFVGCLKSVK